MRSKHTTLRSCSLVRRFTAFWKLPKCRESATTIALCHGFGALLWTLVMEILLIIAANKHGCVYHYFNRKNGRAQQVQISLVGNRDHNKYLADSCPSETAHVYTSFGEFSFSCVSEWQVYNVEETSGSAYFRGSVISPSYRYTCVFAVVQKKQCSQRTFASQLSWLG